MCHLDLVRKRRGASSSVVYGHPPAPSSGDSRNPGGYGNRLHKASWHMGLLLFVLGLNQSGRIRVLLDSICVKILYCELGKSKIWVCV